MAFFIMFEKILLICSLSAYITKFASGGQPILKVILSLFLNSSSVVLACWIRSTLTGLASGILANDEKAEAIDERSSIYSIWFLVNFSSFFSKPGTPSFHDFKSC